MLHNKERERERVMSLLKPSTATLTIISKSSSTLVFLQAAAPGPSSCPSWRHFRNSLVDVEILVWNEMRLCMRWLSPRPPIFLCTVCTFRFQLCRWNRFGTEIERRREENESQRAGKQNTHVTTEGFVLRDSTSVYCVTPVTLDKEQLRWIHEL